MTNSGKKRQEKVVERKEKIRVLVDTSEAFGNYRSQCDHDNRSQFRLQENVMRTLTILAPDLVMIMRCTSLLPTWFCS